MKPKLRDGFQYSTDPKDPKLWPLNLTTEQKLRLMSEVAVDDREAFDHLIDSVLRQEWRGLNADQILDVMDHVLGRGGVR